MTEATATYTLAYDVENRLVQAENAAWCPVGNACAYSYDPLGERKQKVVGVDTATPAATDFVLAGGEEIADYYEASATWRLTVRGAGGLPLAAVIPAGGDGGEEIVYVHHDAKGSTVALTTAGSSGPADTYTYSDYGQPQSGSWSMYQYAGYRYDSETGLNYVNARYYSPALGRFLQTDPAGFGGGMNLYAYTGNDPVNFVDPTGLTPDGSQSYTITLSEAVPSFFGLGSITVSASTTFQVKAQQQNSAAGSGGNNPINLNIAGVSVTGSYSVGDIQPASVYGRGISIDVNTDCSVCAWGQVITRTGYGATGPRIDDESYGPFYGDKGGGAQAFGDTPANGVGQKGTFQGVAVLGVGSEKSKSFVPLGAMIYKYSVDGHGNTSMPIAPRLATASEFKQAVQVLHSGSPGFYVPTP